MTTINLADLMPEEAAFLSTVFPQFVKNNGTNFPVTGLAYDASTDEAAFFKREAVLFGPTANSLTCDFFWYADTASSGDVVWELAIAAITPTVDTQDVETKAFATAQTVTSSHLGTTGQRLHKATITLTNIDTLAANDIIWLRIKRLGSSGSDTMTGDAILVSALISYVDT